MVKNNKFGWGSKMIKVSIHFFTNDLPIGIDNETKTAWARGAIHMVANKSRGLKHNHIFFTDKNDIIPKMNALLKQNGVTLIEAQHKYKTVELGE
jgi:hypothetical protein